MLRTTVVTAFAFGVVVMPVSVSWTGPLEAPPEAVITGSALLALAAILRQFRLQTGSK
jgi:hypothetical protein